MADDSFNPMSRALVLDIETVPLDEAMSAEYPERDRTPPANYKSDEAIAKWRETDRAKWEAGWAKECSLNPRLGRILCVGTGNPHVTHTHTIVSPSPDGEAELLRETWKLLKEASGRVVTWNGSWDLRFILIRSLAHGITPSVAPSVTREWFARYRTFPHYDCKAVLTNWDAPRAGEGLTEWASFLGLDGKTQGISGKDVYPLYQGGMIDEIAEYCAQDVSATRAVYERIYPFFG